MLLEAQSVSRAFGSFMALSRADLTVNEGDIIGLIGPNGAGKSTFFNCLAGEMPPSGGRGLFDPNELQRPSPEGTRPPGLRRPLPHPTDLFHMNDLSSVCVPAL